jgi:hypothetical protein
MDVMLGFLTHVLEPVRAICAILWDYAPSLVTAVLLLAVGSWACMWVRIPVDFIFKIIRIDDHARRSGVGEVLHRMGLGLSLGNLVRTIVSAAVFLGFFVAAMESLDLPVVREYLSRMLAFVPTVVGVVMVLGGGLLIGDILGRIAGRAADANHVRGGEALMRITHAIVVAFSGIFALRLLGIDLVALVTNSTNMMMAALGLGLAIAFGVAFGLAGKDMAERWLRDLTPTKSPSNGHEPRLRVPMKVGR